MAQNDKSPMALSPVKIVTTYAVIAILWIAFSDALLGAFTGTPNSWGQTAKGTFFVLVTAVLLYLMVRRLVASVRQRERERAQSERLYRTVIDATGEGLGQVDPEGRIVFANSKLAGIVGATPERIFGRSMFEFIHPDDAGEVRRRMANRASGISERYETRIITAAGEERTVLISATPAYSDDGKFAGTFAMIFDISDRKRLEQELQHSQKLDAVGRFAGSIAHDFNNVLGIIIGYSSMHHKSLGEGPVRDAFDHILGAATRGATLVRHLLAFSRKQALNTDVVDLNTTVRTFGELLPRLMGDDVSTIVDPAGGELPIRIGTGQIEQVLMNLAVNSRDAMEGGGAFIIATSAARVNPDLAEAQGVDPGDFAVLHVRDSGVGMPPEVLSHIFEPFFTTKGSNQGTGLGLSTVYGIVRQNGGFIQVESAPGQGTTFSVFFPYAATRVESTTEPMHLPPMPSAGNETVLLAEDEPALRELTCHVLRNAGYKVLSAADGATALQLAAKHDGAIDLLLTDMRMPGISGRELANRLQEIRPDMAVAIMSGYSDSSADTTANDAHLIEKPIAPDELLRTIRNILDRRRVSTPRDAA